MTFHDFMELFKYDNGIEMMLPFKVLVLEIYTKVFTSGMTCLEFASQWWGGRAIGGHKELMIFRLGDGCLGTHHSILCAFICA